MYGGSSLYTFYISNKNFTFGANHYPKVSVVTTISPMKSGFLMLWKKSFRNCLACSSCCVPNLSQWNLIDILTSAVALCRDLRSGKVDCYSKKPMSLHEGNKAWAALRCSCTSPSLRFARSFSNTRLGMNHSLHASLCKNQLKILEDKALHSQNLSQLLSRVEQHLGVTQVLPSKIEGRLIRTNS